MNPSRNHTITSSYQMRKPRHQNNVNGEKSLKCTPSKANTPENENQCKFEVTTKRGVCSKQPLRPWRLTHRMKGTTAVICSSPDDSEPEITWAPDSQIPEKRAKPGDTGESVLNLLKRVFPSTKPKRANNEDNYIDLWLARRKENDIVHAPVKSNARSAVRARSQLEKKFQIAEELQQLVNQVANAAAAKDNEHGKRTNNLGDPQRMEQSNLYDRFKQNSNPEVPHRDEMRASSNDDIVSTNNICDDQGDTATQPLFIDAPHVQSLPANSAILNPQPNSIYETKCNAGSFKNPFLSSAPLNTEAGTANDNTPMPFSLPVTNWRTIPMQNLPVAPTITPVRQCISVKECSIIAKPENNVSLPGISNRKPSKEHDWAQDSTSAGGAQNKKTEVTMDDLGDIMNCATQPYIAESEKASVNKFNLSVVNLSNRGACSSSKIVNKNSSDDEWDSDDIWDNDDIFNDDEFIQATQCLFSDVKSEKGLNSNGMLHIDQPFRLPETKSNESCVVGSSANGNITLNCHLSSLSSEKTDCLSGTALHSKSGVVVRPMVQCFSAKAFPESGMRKSNPTQPACSSKIVLEKSCKYVETAGAIENKVWTCNEIEDMDSDDILNCATQPYTDIASHDGCNLGTSDGANKPKNPMTCIELGDSSSDNVWDDEDIFNDEKVVLATQQPLPVTTKLQSCNLNGLVPLKSLPKLQKTINDSGQFKDGIGNVNPAPSYGSRLGSLHAASSSNATRCSTMVMHNSPVPKNAMTGTSDQRLKNVKNVISSTSSNACGLLMNPEFSCVAPHNTDANQVRRVPQSEADDLSDDVWENEDIFNDEEFILATQQLFSAATGSHSSSLT